MWRCEDPELKKLFHAGGVPNLESLVGENGMGPAEWQVVMLTGPIPNLGGKWFRHRKMFMWAGDVIIGRNVLFDDFRWGRFEINYPTVKLDDGGNAVLIDYAVPKNSFLTRAITDHIRTTSDPHELIGRFNYKGRFWGYFKLRKLKGNG